MNEPPTVIVHALDHALLALALARPVTLLSAPGAALFLGCAGWRALIARARAAHSDVTVVDILDCADASGYALSALRLGQRDLVLWHGAPGREAVGAIAARLGARLREHAPPALDLGARGAAWRLPGWLGVDDREGGLG